MEIPNCYYRVSIKALILDETRTKFLLVQEDNKWELPGGGLDWGESPVDGLTREIKEEMGLTVTRVVPAPVYFTTGQRRDNDKRWAANIVYETTLENLDFTPSSECVELRFFTKDEALEANLFTGTKVFLEVFDPANHK